MSPQTISDARNTLTRKIMGERGTISIKLDTQGMSDGQRAGMTFLGKDSGNWIGVIKISNRTSGNIFRII